MMSNVNDVCLMNREVITENQLREFIQEGNIDGIVQVGIRRKFYVVHSSIGSEGKPRRIYFSSGG